MNVSFKFVCLYTVPVWSTCELYFYHDRYDTYCSTIYSLYVYSYIIQLTLPNDDTMIILCVISEPSFIRTLL